MFLYFFAQIHQRLKAWCDRGNLAFPLSELQAAVLLPQWEELERHNRRRLEVVERLRREKFPGLQLVAARPDRGQPSFYKLAWYPSPECRPKLSRDELLAALWKHRLPFDVGFRGFAARSTRRCRKPTDLSYCERAAAETIVMHHPILVQSDQIVESMIGELQLALTD